jgi:protein-L-isoaspartate(D-aspartate) O-methyltransferase
LARWLNCLDWLSDRFLHRLRCYCYTAIVARRHPAQRCGVEIDPWLAERAQRNLRGWQNVVVVSGDAAELHAGTFDAIFVNAGATEPLLRWLDALRLGGRLLVPLTVGVPEENVGVGHMLLVVRHANTYAARFVSPFGIFHCTGARSNKGSDLLSRAYREGGHDAVRSLRRDMHDSDPHCWLHAGRFCLSRLEI